MQPTVADVLALPEVREGRPEVLAGHDQLDREVRWAHMSELADVATLLSGGELVLTTGIALPEDAQDVVHYVEDLVEADASGLLVELGRRYATLPEPLVRAARRLHLPLVALHREARFVAITEAVHALVLTGQLRELQASDLVHRTFTALTLEGAPPAEILRTVTQLTGAPVVLENLARQVLVADEGNRPRAEVLRDWEARSRRAPTPDRTAVTGPEGWLVAAVGARGEIWGRLVLLDQHRARSQPVIVLERAAAALALHRMVERDQASLERQAHRSLLSDIIGSGGSMEADVHARAEALGVRLNRRALVPLVVRCEAGDDSGLSAPARDREIAEAVSNTLRLAGHCAIVATLRAGETGLLLALDTPGARRRALDGLVPLVHRSLRASGATGHVGVGSTVTSVADVRRSFAEATQVAEAARGLTSSPKPYYELPDVRLRGLVHLLRDDPRLQSFVERELGPLHEHDQRTRGDLAEALRAFLENGRNKSAAADAFRLSRPSFYQRLERIEQVLSVDLDDVDACLSLHVALVALESMRGQAPRGAARDGVPPARRP